MDPYAVLDAVSLLIYAFGYAMGFMLGRSTA